MTVGEITDLIMKTVGKTTSDLDAIAAYAIKLTIENAHLNLEIDMLKDELAGKYDA